MTHQRTLERDLCVSRKRVPVALVSPMGLPRHLETVWGFLLRTEPGAFDFMMDPVKGLLEDDGRARKIAGAYGVSVPLFRVEGMRIGAYPLHVLHEVFPVSP